MKGIKQEIRLLRLKDLIQYPNNPQKMSDKEYKGLVDSMRKQGWLLDPCVCQEKKDGSLHILSGNHRVTAAIEAGILEANCKVLTGLTEKQARLLVLEANQRRGKFDDKLLNDFIDSISIDFDIDLDSIYDDIGVINIQEDEIKEKEITKESLNIENKCPKCGYYY